MLGCAGNGATLKELKVWAFQDFIRGIEARPHACSMRVYLLCIF